MALPAWVGRKEREALRPVQMKPMATSIWDAPGWRLWGRAFWTCVPPADMPIEPVVLRAIREFDPGAIPIWRKQRYLPPGSTRPVTFTHFAIARHVRDPKGEQRLFHVEMPPNARHPVPNLLEYVLQVRGERMMHHGGPGDFLPFSMGLYHALRDRFLVNKVARQLADEQIRREEEALARYQEQVAADSERRQEYLDKKLSPVIERVTRSDWLRYLGRVTGKTRETKPYVFVGRHA